MVCKSCGATVREGQFTCSSCGAYLSKDTKVKTDSLEERSALLGVSDLYSHKTPVIINEGWKWYTFVTWGLIPIYTFSAIFEIPEYFKISFLLGLMCIAYIVLGIMAHINLKEFTRKGIYLCYTFLIMPIIMLFITCSAVLTQMREIYGNDLNIDTFDILKQGSTGFTLLRNVILIIVNIIYFQNRKDEFRY